MIVSLCIASGAGCGQEPPPAGCPPSDPLPRIESAQQVTFEFSTTNPEQQTFVLTDAEFCRHYSIHKTDGTELVLSPPYRTVCEGPPPPGASYSGRLLSTNPVVTWDARELHPYTDCYDCEAEGWVGSGLAFYDVHVPQPVTAGDYRATFLVADGVDFPCDSFDGETIDCYADEGDDFTTESCPHIGRTVTVDFTLPDVGDVVVPVVVDGLL